MGRCRRARGLDDEDVELAGALEVLAVLDGPGGEHGDVLADEPVVGGQDLVGEVVEVALGLAQRDLRRRVAGTRVDPCPQLRDLAVELLAAREESVVAGAELVRGGTLLAVPPRRAAPAAARPGAGLGAARGPGGV